MAPDLREWNWFLEQLADAQAELGDPALIWYRGVGRQAYDLQPSLMRDDVLRTRERALFFKYKQIASRVLDVRRDDDWDYLFDMQHYNIPTRLLDWTEVLGVAVFFALFGDDSEPGAVYILDPMRLNRKYGRDEVPVLGPDTGLKYREQYWDNKPTFVSHPIAVEPPFNNSRIHSQRGKFTIHGNDARPVDELAPDCIRKVLLSREAKPGARYFLRLSGIDEFSVFPDIVGMVPFIRNIAL